MKLFEWFTQRNDHNSQKKRNIDNTNVHDTKDHVQDDRKSRRKRDIDNANVPTTKDGEQSDDRKSRKNRSKVPDTNQIENTLDPRHISDSMRKEVLKRDGYKCVECGSTSSLELDHIIPHNKGGATSVKNLQVLCRQCNRKKGSS